MRSSLTWRTSSSVSSGFDVFLTQSCVVFDVVGLESAVIPAEVLVVVVLGVARVYDEFQRLLSILLNGHKSELHGGKLGCLFLERSTPAMWTGEVCGGGGHGSFCIPCLGEAAGLLYILPGSLSVAFPACSIRGHPESGAFRYPQGLASQCAASMVVRGQSGPRTKEESS